MKSGGRRGAEKSVLKPERSSHITTSPNPTIKPLCMISAVSTDSPATNPSFATSTQSITNSVPDEEDEIFMQGVNRYKEHYHVAKKQVSDLRLETAEALRELKEARMMIGTLEHKNRKLEAEKEKPRSDLREAMAPTLMMNAEERIAELAKGKEKAESRRGIYKSQFKTARRDFGIAKDHIAYLEALLAFEERSGYSSMMSGQQLGRGWRNLGGRSWMEALYLM